VEIAAGSITQEEFDERYPRLFAGLTRLGQALGVRISLNSPPWSG
jgi:hypothetical protein